MKYILDKLIKWANLKGIAISMAAFIVSVITVNGSLVGVKAMKKVSNGVGILDLEPNYTVEKAYEMLETMGAIGRQFYLTRIIPLDCIFLVSYGIAFSLIVLVLVNKLMPKNEPALGLAYIPLTAMTFDLLENISVTLMLTKFPTQLVSVVQLSNLFTIIKSSLIGFTMVLIVLFFLALMIKSGAGKVGLR